MTQQHRSLPIAGRATQKPIDPSLDLEEEITRLKKEKSGSYRQMYRCRTPLGRSGGCVGRRQDF